MTKTGFLDSGKEKRRLVRAVAQRERPYHFRAGSLNAVGLHERHSVSVQRLLDLVKWRLMAQFEWYRECFHPPQRIFFGAVFIL